MESKPGEGSTFWFDIKYKYSEEVRETAPASPDGLNKLSPLKIRVLVAEDNQMNILVLKKLLSYWNVDFEIAENGEELLQKVRQQ